MYGIGSIVVSLERDDACLGALLYELGTTRAFSTPFPPQTDDVLALHWCLDLSVREGAYGEVVVLHPGPFNIEQIKAAVVASRLLREVADAN